MVRESGFAVAFISKPILYELDAITHPLHDQPRPVSKHEAEHPTVTDVDRLPFADEVEGFNAEGEADGDLGGKLEGQLKGDGPDEADGEDRAETVAKEASPSTQAHQLRTPLGAGVGDAAESAACATRDARLTLTEDVQAELYTLNHPRDCGAALLLECDSSKGLDQGTGSRLFYLTRCGVA